MAINRRVWDEALWDGHVPKWPCPGCGHLSLRMKEKSFITIDDGTTSREGHRDDFEPEFVSGRFVCLLQCQESDCRESCSVSGNFSMRRDPTDDSLDEVGRPISISPPPPMIDIPKKCPETVNAEIVAAFSSYWGDLSACLNHIRSALELLLDNLRVPRRRRGKNGKLSQRTLHDRIDRLKEIHPKMGEICDRMKAVKHLGNAGSHPSGEISKEDVFDAFDILEKVLEDLYSDHLDLLAEKVKQINKRRGPSKR